MGTNHDESTAIGRLAALVDQAERAAYDALGECVFNADLPEEVDVVAEELRRVVNRLRGLSGRGGVSIVGPRTGAAAIKFSTGDRDRSPGGRILEALLAGEDPPGVQGTICAEVRAFYPGLALVAEGRG